MRPTEWTGKRLLDFVVATALLVATAPAQVLVAMLIWLDDGLPIFFRQRRVGLNGRPFVMWKFRTMINDAVAIGIEKNLSADPFGVIPNDPRITRTGTWLRRTSLDELPQLLNVFKGDMSLVGPRPDIPEQVVNYSANDRKRLAVRPGITGYAQVRGRDEIPWPERIRLDNIYVDNNSLRGDLTIIFQTLAQIRRPEVNPVFDDWNVKKRLRSPETTDEEL